MGKEITRYVRMQTLSQAQARFEVTKSTASTYQVGVTKAAGTCSSGRNEHMSCTELSKV